MITKHLDRERTIKLARLSLCLEEKFGTIRSSNQKFRNALSKEMHAVLDSVKEEVASGELRNR
jgi:hypothetical protein